MTNDFLKVELNIKSMKSQTTTTLRFTIKTIMVIIALMMSGITAAQTTVTLEDQCNCEVLQGTDVSTPGAVTPAGADLGDLYVNTDTGTIYFWDGDSWELTTTDDQNLQNFSFDAATNILSLEIEDGNTVTADLSTLNRTASEIVYDNSSSLLSAINVQDAIDEINAAVGTVALVDNGDGTYDFTSADGNITTIGDTSISTLNDNGDGTYTYTDESGLEQIIDTNSITISNTITGNRIATVTEADGTTADIQETIISIVDNNDGNVTLVNEAGASVTIAKSDITANPDGTYTFTNNDGSDVTIDTNGLVISNLVAGNRIATVTEADGTTADINETITSIVDNNDGNVTLVNEAGASVTIAKSDITANPDGTYTFTNNDGSDVTIDTNGLVISNLVAGNRIATVTEADGTTADINETITSIVDNNDGNVTLVNEAGASVTIAKSDITANPDGTYTFTNNDGSDVIIDTNGLVISNLVAGNRIATVTEADGTTADINETITDISGTLTSGNEIGVYEKEDGTTVSIQETITSIVDNNDGNVTLVNEAGASVTIAKSDITANPDGTYTFTNNDGSDVTIDTNGLVISNLVAGNRIATVTEADGTTADINETITSIVDNNDGNVTLVNEAGASVTIAKSDITANPDGTYTFTNNDGSDVIIDTNGLVISNLVAGNRIATVTEADGTTADINETITDISGTLTTGNEIGVYEKEDGTTVSIQETITSIVDNNDGNVTLVNEAGASITIAKSDITANPDGTYTFTNNDGSDVTIDTNGLVISNLVAGNRIATVTEADGTTADINETITDISGTLTSGNEIGVYEKEDGTTVSIQETITSIVDNNDGNVTLVNEAGASVTIAKSDITANPDGTYTFTNNDGSDVIIDTNGLVISNLVAGNRIATVTEADGTTADINETITSIVDNNDGNVTLVNEAGASVTIAKSDITANPDGTYTFTNNDGSDVTIDTNGLVISNLVAGNRIATVTEADGTTADINETITDISGTLTSGNEIGVYEKEDGTTVSIQETITSIVDNNDGNVTLVNEAGASVTIAKSDITANPDGTYTFTNNDGSDVTIDTNGLVISNLVAGNRIATVTEADGTTADINETITDISGTLTSGNEIGVYEKEDGTTVSIQETITSIVDNNDGNVTLVNEAGASVTIAKSDITANPDGTYTFTNNDGSDVTIDTNGLVISNLVAGNRIATVTEADGTTADINETITSIVDNNDGTLTFTREDNSTQTITKSQLTDNGNGTFTFNNGDGAPISFDGTDDQDASQVNLLTPIDVDGDLVNETTVEDAIADLANNSSDNQNLTGATLNGANQLQIDIERGTSTNVDLSSLSETVTAGTGAITVDDDGNGNYTVNSVDSDEDETNELAVLASGPPSSNGTNSGDTYVDTDNGQLYAWDGTSWQQVGGSAAPDADPNPENELSDVALTGTTLELTNPAPGATGVDLNNRFATDQELTDAITASELLDGDKDDQNELQDLEDVLTRDPSAAGNVIMDLGTPVNANDAVNKAYVDNLADDDVSVTNIVGGNRIATISEPGITPVDVNETITTLADNGNGSFTYTNENGAPVSFQASTITDNGDGTSTIGLADGGTITVDNDGVDNVDDADNDPRNEITTVADNGDGTSTIADVDGNSVTVDNDGVDNVDDADNDPRNEITTVADNGDGTSTIADVDGNSVTVDNDGVDNVDDADNDPRNEITTVADNGNGTSTIADVDGNSVTVDNDGVDNVDDADNDPRNEITTVADNGDGTSTIADVDGNSVTVDNDGVDNVDDADNVIGNEYNTGSGITNGTLEITDGGGTESVNLISTNADNDITFGTDGALYLNVASVTISETITTLADNGDGSFTYTNENGAPVSFQASTITDNGDGTSTIGLADGGTITVDNDGVDNVDDADNDPRNEIQTVASGDGSVDVVRTGDDFDLSVTFPVNNDNDPRNEITTVADNGDGTSTIADVDGNSVTVDNDGVDNVDDADNDPRNEITTVADNGDGTSTIADVDGNSVTVDNDGVDNVDDADNDPRNEITTVADNGDGTSTIADVDGNSVTVDNDGVDNVDDADNDPRNEITTVADNGDGTSTIADVDGNSVTVDNDGVDNVDDADNDPRNEITTVADNGDGTSTIADVDGNSVTVDNDGVDNVDDADNDPRNEIQTVASGDGSVDVVRTGDDFDLSVTFPVNNDNDPRNEITTVADNGDGTSTIADVDGNSVTVDNDGFDNVDDADNDPRNEITTVADNGNGTSTIADVDGNSVTVDNDGVDNVDDADNDPRNEITTVADNGDGTSTIADVDGNSVTVDNDGVDNVDDADNDPRNEITTVADNGDGTSTIADVDGNSVTVDNDGVDNVDDADNVIGNEYNTGSGITNGTLEITDGGGTESVNLISTNADNDLAFGTDGALYLNVASVTISETITTLADNGDGSFTYTNENGAPVSFQASTITDNGDETSTIGLADGGTITVDNDGVDNVDDADNDPRNEITTVADNGDGTSTIADVDGNSVTVDNDGVDNVDDADNDPRNEITTVADNGDGTSTIADVDGNSVTVDNDGVDNVDDADNDPRNEITTVADNGDGTSTIADVDGNSVTVDNDGVDNVDDADNDPRNEIQTVASGNGSVDVVRTGDDFDLSVTFPVNNDNDPRNEITTVADNGDGTSTIADVDGNSVTVDNDGVDNVDDADNDPRNEITTVADNGDGTSTIADVDGNSVTVDNDGVDNVDDADNDPRNEIQTVASGDGSVDVVRTGDDFDLSVTFPVNNDNDPRNEITTVADNGDGTSTIADVDGNSVTVDNDGVDNVDDADNDPRNEITTVADNGNGTSTIADVDGNSVTVDNDGVDNVDDADNVIGNEYNTGSGITNGTLEITDGGGTESVNLISTNADNDLAFGTDGALYLNVASVTISETITTLADNGDGSFTYTNENGAPVSFQASTITDNGDGTSTIGLADGGTITVDNDGVDNVDDADSDPTNENQTVSAGTGISVNQVGQNFEVTNTAPDQTVSIADGGNGNVTVGGTYPNFTIDVPDATVDTDDQDLSSAVVTANESVEIQITDGNNTTIDIRDADSDATNEYNTAFGISGSNLRLTDGGGNLDVPLSSLGTDEQDLSSAVVTANESVEIQITDGNNTTIDIRDADSDPTNENQTVSAGTGMSVNQVGQNFEVTNTAPDQTVSIADGGNGNVTVGGTYPNFTIDVPDATVDTDDQDLSSAVVTANESVEIQITDGNNTTIDIRDADSDATNEYNTAFGISGSNLRLTDGGGNLDVPLSSLGTDEQDLSSAVVTANESVEIQITDGNNTTIDIRDADSDPTNENQTVSAGTGMSVNQVGQNFEVTNTAPDQTVSIADGGNGNVTVGGTYPNFTIDVPDATVDTDDQDLSSAVVTANESVEIQITDGNNTTIDIRDADSDPTNENQTVSAGTGMSVNQVGQNFEVTNTAPDQTVSIADGGNGNVTVGGTYPNFTIDVPDATVDTDDQDLSSAVVTANESVEIQITDGNNTTIDIRDADSDATNEYNTAFGISGSNLRLTDGGGNLDVPLSSLGTDEQDLSSAVVTANESVEIQITNGNNTTIDIRDADSDPTNENQTVSAGTGMSVNQVGQNFEVTNTAPDQTVSIADGGNGNVTVGGTYPNFTIDVPDATVDTDDQDLSSSVVTANESVEIQITDGNNTTIDIRDADSDATNEYNTAFGISGSNLRLTDGGGNLDVPLSSLGTDEQDLSSTVVTANESVEIQITNGNNTTIDIRDADSNPSNELQTISRTGTNVVLSNGGGTVSIADNDNNSNNEIQNITSTDGSVTISQTGINYDLSVPAAEETVVTAGTDISVTGDGSTATPYVISNTRPNIFYPPSIAVDVATTGTGRTIDLHAEYLSQYGTPSVASAGAPAAIPTYANNELYYYVTYYDPTVFANVSVDAVGEMTYDVISTPTDYNTLINVVFVAR
ncbi:beta strand repeat-containing protein [Maribacter sp. LLG6340-A2]|uniref:beta strand repeat-containing protein n=1 Tax=Maribacter sp. LLG6340-A2 TaxID=3160834 RepID=UPI003866C22C